MKKQAKKHFLTNLEHFDLMVAFFGALSSSKLVYICAKGALSKFLGSVTKNGYLKINQRGNHSPHP